MKKRIIIFLVASFVLLAEKALIAQKEANIWYFGAYAGLDFSTSPPTILANGAMGANEGCATISDSAGNLLFYTDGMTVWNRTHTVMANGNNLYGGSSSTSQSALILPKPENHNLYYIFTNTGGTSYGLHYSLVDMSLAAGNGSLISKNISLFSPTAEKLCATKHANNIDYWIITHEFNSNKFISYLLTAAGVNTIANTSATGPSHNSWNAIGYMKFSTDGKKLGLAAYDQSSNGRFELYDFDNVTGLVSNPLVLGNTFNKSYGCEFSPDGTKFYGGGWSEGTLWQWDLCAGSSSGIVASQVAVISVTGALGAMQLAPDGKIYVVRLFQETLGVINKPDAVGIGCNYLEQGYSVAPKLSGHGLPNFPAAYFYPGSTLSITATGNFTMCAGDTKTLFVAGAQSYTWNSTIAGPTLVVSPPTTSVFIAAGTTSAGCVFEESITITVSPCVSLVESAANSSALIYPNPALEFIYIAMAGQNDYKIFAVSGKLVKAGAINGHIGKLNVGDLPNGLYYLHLHGGRTPSNHKFIIQR